MEMVRYIKKTLKILIVFLIIQIMLFMMLNTPVFADGEGLISGTFSDGDGFIEMGESEAGNMGIDIDSAFEPMREIGQFVIFVGFILACVKILLLIPTLKGDSPDARARAKKSFALFLIIAITLAAAFSLWSIILRALGQASGAEGDVDTVIDSMNTSDMDMADMPTALTNVFTLLISVAQVGVTGYFVIRFTWEGIKYFSTTAVGEKADLKKKLTWTLLWGALAFGATSIMRLIYNIFSK